MHREERGEGGGISKFCQAINLGKKIRTTPDILGDYFPRIVQSFFRLMHWSKCSILTTVGNRNCLWQSTTFEWQLVVLLITPRCYIVSHLICVMLHTQIQKPGASMESRHCDRTKKYSFVLSTMPRLHARSRLLD